jgi:hypothetical protein
MHMYLMHLTLLPGRDCILVGGDCLLPVAALAELRSFEVDECAGLNLLSLSRFLNAAVQGSSLKVELSDTSIPCDDALWVYCHIRD